MPETILIRLTAPTLPVGFCPVDYQQEWSEAIALTQAELLVNGVSSFYNFGDATPDPNNRSFPWIRTILGEMDDVYAYVAGFWLATYKPAPSGPNGIRWWYEGSETSLLTFDGGENAPVGLRTGPFWEVDHAYDGRIAMGAGAIPGSFPAKTLAVSEDFGSGGAMQTADQIGPHLHPIQPSQMISAPGTGTDSGILYGGTGTVLTPLSVQSNEYTTTQEPIPIIPPVRGGYMIRRTARKFKRA